MKIPYNEYYAATHSELRGTLSSGRVKASFKKADREDEVRLEILIRLTNPESPSSVIKVYFDEVYTLEELETLTWEYNFVSSMIVYGLMARLRANEELIEKSEDYGLNDVLDSIETFLEDVYEKAVKELLKTNNVNEE